MNEKSKIQDVITRAINCLVRFPIADQQEVFENTLHILEECRNDAAEEE